MGFGIYWFRNRQVLHKFANEPTKLRVMAQKDFIFWTMRQHHREVSNGFGIAAGTFHVRLLKCRNKKINSNKQKRKQMFLGARKASVKLILTVGIFVRSKQDFSARISVIFRESAD